MTGLSDLASLWDAAMRRGDYEAVWHVSDLVLAGRSRTERDDPSLPYHRRWVWDGSRFAGRDVLVRCYHGLGDTLQFARFLPALGDAAASMTVECQPELIRLLGPALPSARFVPFDVAAPLPRSDCDLEIMELSHALRLRPDAVACPYLHPPAEDVAAAARRLRPGPVVGLCWRAGGWDPDRAIDRADLLAACAASPADLFALDPRADPALPSLFVDGRPPRDVAETAAYAAGMARIVTIDTMIAHLAGALGRPCLLLLRKNADWRWGDQPHDTALYPTLRLLRQQEEGCWQRPLADLRRQLAGRALCRRRSPPQRGYERSGSLVADQRGHTSPE